LGFYRGIKSHKYKYDNDKYKINQNYLYSDSMIGGIHGLMGYLKF
jgi:hypothetical protein